ncbi:MAG: motility protein A, partial [Clostridiales bacterium]|nr:motility protein A [Clostridiales bacterium]
MDLGSVLGATFSIGFMILSLMITVGFDMPALMAYVDGPSILITFGGSIGSILWGLPLDRLITGLKSITLTFTPPKLDPKGAIANIIQLS